MKAMKRAVFIGILLLISGAVVFVVGMSALGWDFTRLDREELTEAHFSSANEIDSVSLEGSWDFEIVRGDEFSVQYYTSSISEITVKETKNPGSDKYSFSFKETRNSWFSIGFNGIKRSGLTVVVTVTEDCTLTADGSDIKVTAENQDFKNVKINGSSAKACLTNINAEDMTLSGSDIKAYLNTVTAKDMTLSGSSARFELNKTQAKNITAKGSDCKVILQDSAVEGKISLEASSGKLTLNHSSAKDVYVKGSSLRVETENADIRTFEGHGSSLRANLNLTGAESDIKSAAVSGSDPKLFIGGTKDKSHSYNNDGFKTFTADGSSVRLDINMKGGESIFTE